LWIETQRKPHLRNARNAAASREFNEVLAIWCSGGRWR